MSGGSLGYRRRHGFKQKLPGYVGIRQKPEQSKVVCTKYTCCKGCPYPRHGLTCWGKDGSCLRDDMRNIYQRMEKRNENSDQKQNPAQ